MASAFAPESWDFKETAFQQLLSHCLVTSEETVWPEAGAERLGRTPLGDKATAALRPGPSLAGARGLPEGRGFS